MTHRILAAVACAALLAGCDQPTAQRVAADATRAVIDSALGTNQSLRLVPISRANFGELVVTPTRLTLGDGTSIPLERIGTGVFATPSLATAEGARRFGFCGNTPITHMTLHVGPQDVYYVNLGNWPSAPSTPRSDEQNISGACAMSAYEPAA